MLMTAFDIHIAMFVEQQKSEVEKRMRNGTSDDGNWMSSFVGKDTKNSFNFFLFLFFLVQMGRTLYIHNIVLRKLLDKIFLCCLR